MSWVKITLCNYKQHCFFNTIKSFAISHWILTRMMCDDINYDTDYICVWEHFKENKCNDVHLYFHDEDKSWRSSILYHTVANANRHLYFCFWYSHFLTLIVLCCKPLFVWFLIDFFCYLLQKLCLKWT